jgi:hypothetical protein
MTTFHRQPADRVRRAGLFAALVVGGLVAGLGGQGGLAHEEHGMPARLQQGTCAEIGPVAFALNGVDATEDADGNELAAPQGVGAESAVEVHASVTTVAATLDAILSGGHALIVYLSDDAMDQPVACGDVGGIVVGEDLVVGLEARGDEGMSGVALFRAAGEETVVSVFLTSAAHEDEGDDDHDSADDHDDEHEGTPAA